MYRCGDFSDSESDIEEHNRCFNFDTPSLFGKRKHSDGDATEKNKGDASGEPDVVPRKVFRNWFRRDHANVGPQNTDDFDPTYGFAKQLESRTDNRTYIRNSNAVDTSIPIANMDYMGVDYQDVLYPLRTSTGSNDSSTSTYFATTNGHRSNEHNKSPTASAMVSNSNVFLPATPTRKRVKFDERSNKVNVFRRHPHHYHHHNQSQFTKGYSGYSFKAELEDSEKLTLRQRIANFFAHLF